VLCENRDEWKVRISLKKPYQKYENERKNRSGHASYRKGTGTWRMNISSVTREVENEMSLSPEGKREERKKVVV